MPNGRHDESWQDQVEEHPDDDSSEDHRFYPGVNAHRNDQRSYDDEWFDEVRSSYWQGSAEPEERRRVDLVPATQAAARASAEHENNH